MVVNMGNVWDRATEFVRDNLPAILPVAVGAILLPGAISAGIAPLAAQSASAGPVVTLAGLVLTVVTLWGQLAIVALAIEPLAGRRTALRIAGRRLAPTIGLSLLLLIGVIALVMPVPIVLGATGYDFQAAMAGTRVEPAAGVSAFTAIYVLILIPAIVYLAARLMLTTPVVLVERRGAGAFRRSFALTRGIVWKLIGVMILYLIVFGVAVLAARTVFGSILELIAGGEGAISVATVLTALLVSAVQTVLAVLAMAFVGKLYLAVRDARGAIVDSK